ncbi:hypothetical protein LY474_22005 [Myxococcus stipitatus]|uniref:hypothetical protein n=1 Tax=Myxococcus stipitatus TaxID=83455 RepID=UPI001F357AED|nr:hypothetical protein [Myxococcus stipitatus]MCE9670481.1 hypothetical protein [Myxococcus stipitatus]
MRTYAQSFITLVDEKIADKNAVAEVKAATLQAQQALWMENDEAYVAAMHSLDAAVAPLSTGDQHTIAELGARLLESGIPGTGTTQP